jgi:hypothetical protein
MNKLFLLLLCLLSVNSFYMSDKILNKILLSLKTKNKLENLIKFSSLNNPISNYSKKNINNYLLNSKYNIIYDNFDIYRINEVITKNKTQKFYNININLRNITNRKNFLIDNTNNVYLIFHLVNENKNKWRFENFYFNNI